MDKYHTWEGKDVLWTSVTDNSNIVCSLEESTRLIYISVYAQNRMEYIPKENELFHVCITEDQYHYFLHPDTNGKREELAHRITNKQCLFHYETNNSCDICKDLTIIKVMLS
jgi:hypothetical protein